VKLLIVDRDGVVSRDPDGRAARTEGWRCLPGSAAAIARLVHGGWRVALMADRGPLARGTADMSGLVSTHGRLLDEIERAGGRVDAVLFVPAPDAPGRTVEAAASIEETLSRMQVAPESTVVVADGAGDLEAAAAAGCRTMLVLSGHGRETFGSSELPPGTVVRVDLSAIAAELAP
jgi:D-glycero-D-manno-heptose 1,7-bisphosphate phosphatase